MQRWSVLSWIASEWLQLKRNGRSFYRRFRVLLVVRSMSFTRMFSTQVMEFGEESGVPNAPK